MVEYSIQEVLVYGLTPEGSQIAEQGSHEARVWAALPMKGEGSPFPIKDLKAKVGDEAAKVGQGRAFKNGWIGKEGDGLVKLVRQFHIVCVIWQLIRLKQVPTIDDVTRNELTEVNATGTLKSGEKALAELRKRKLVVQK